MHLRSKATAALLLASSALCSAEPVREAASGAPDREAIMLTVYNDDLALVRERRRVELPSKLTRISLSDVAAQIRPETALLRAAGGAPVMAIEQNFDYDLLTPEKLLEKYVGREVTVIRSNPTTFEEKSEKATVLAAGSGTVLRFADRIETGSPGRIAFDRVPPNLREKPTLSVLLESSAGKRTLELSYLTGGMSWKTDYVANLSGDGKSFDLNGWVTLSNRSGADFDEAHLQLVAGTVNRVRPPASRWDGMPAPAPVAMKSSALPAQENLMDFHLYSFERPVSIRNNQTKQLALLFAAAIPAHREYQLAGNEWYYRSRYDQPDGKLHPETLLVFANKGGEMGKPLPSGVIRVYAPDSHGAAQFVGEDRINHTAKNETVKLRLGEAYDVSATRRQTSFKRIADNGGESAWKIELANAGSEPVSVKVREPMPGDWEIVQESAHHEQESSRVAAWMVTVPAQGRTTLDYTVRAKW